MRETIRTESHVVHGSMSIFDMCVHVSVFWPLCFLLTAPSLPTLADFLLTDLLLEFLYLAASLRSMNFLSRHPSPPCNGTCQSARCGTRQTTHLLSYILKVHTNMKDVRCQNYQPFKASLESKSIVCPVERWPEASCPVRQQKSLGCVYRCLYIGKPCVNVCFSCSMTATEVTDHQALPSSGSTDGTPLCQNSPV